MIKTNKQEKTSPKKYLVRKPDVLQASRQSLSTPKTPSQNDTRKQLLPAKYNETQYRSRTPSNRSSLASSREPTPKTPNPPKQFFHEDKHDRKLSVGEKISLTNISSIQSGKYINWQIDFRV